MKPPIPGSEGIAKEDGLAPEDRVFLQRLSRWIAERRMAVPAVLILESVKPLNFIGSQMMFFFEPIVKAFIGGQGYTRFARLMERRENVETFLEFIELAENETRNEQKEENR